MELLLVEKNGWSKPVRIERAITTIGSGSDSNIQLPSTNINSDHLQLLFSVETPSKCKLVNLASTVSVLSNQTPFQIKTYDSLDLLNGDQIFLGDYTISIKLDSSPNRIQTGEIINAELNIRELTLNPGFGIIGLITVKNSGSQSACQFQIEIEGLPEGCYQLDPVPLLYPGGSEEVRLKIFHVGHAPAAGNHTFYIRVTSPESYPGEECVIDQNIFVTPTPNYTITLIDDLKESINKFTEVKPLHNPKINQESYKVEPKNIDQNLAPTESLVQDQIRSETSSEEEDLVLSIHPEPESSVEVELSTPVKIMRNPTDLDSFWDDKK